MPVRKSSKVDLNKMVRGAARAVEGNSREKGDSLKRDIVKTLLKQIERYGKTIQKIPCDIILLDENIRKSYSDEALEKLAGSLSVDGLIQYPTLCLKENEQGYRLICRNGHRRVMAAKKLGWKKIECVIFPFDSVKDELYHSINANLRENVFYLDIADAYCEAHNLGESDQDIAKRVGVNMRTVRWYRRLSKMSKHCASLVRKHPDLFNATWAIRLARKGDLPPSKVLERWMHRMIKEGKTFITEPNSTSSTGESFPVSQLKSHFKGKDGAERVTWTRLFLEDLVKGGYIKASALKKIEMDVLGGSFGGELKKTAAKRGRATAKSRGSRKQLTGSSK